MLLTTKSKCYSKASLYFACTVILYHITSSNPYPITNPTSKSSAKEGHSSSSNDSPKEIGGSDNLEIILPSSIGGDESLSAIGKENDIRIVYRNVTIADSQDDDSLDSTTNSYTDILDLSVINKENILSNDVTIIKSQHGNSTKTSSNFVSAFPSVSLVGNGENYAQTSGQRDLSLDLNASVENKDDSNYTSELDCEVAKGSCLDCRKISSHCSYDFETQECSYSLEEQKISRKDCLSGWVHGQSLSEKLSLAAIVVVVLFGIMVALIFMVRCLYRRLDKSVGPVHETGRESTREKRFFLLRGSNTSSSNQTNRR